MPSDTESMTRSKRVSVPVTTIDMVYPDVGPAAWMHQPQQEVQQQTDPLAEALRKRRQRAAQASEEAQLKAVLLADEAESLEAEKRVLGLRGEVQALRSGLRPGQQGGSDVNTGATPNQPMAAISVADAQKLAELPEEKRQQVLSVMAMANGSIAGGQNAMLLPLLMGYSQNHSGTDVAKFGETLISALQTGVQMATPKGSSEDVKDKMLLMAFEKALAGNGTPKNDAIETIKSLKEAGLVYTPADVSKMLAEAHGASSVPLQTGPSNTDLELKRMDMQNQLELKRIDSNQSIEMAKLGIEKQKGENLTNVITRIGNTVGRAMANGEMFEFEEQGATKQGMPPDAPSDDVRKEPCPKCGTEISIPEPGKARKIKCVNPACGIELDYDPSK